MMEKLIQSISRDKYFTFFSPRENITIKKFEIEKLDRYLQRLTKSPAEALKIQSLELLPVDVEKGTEFAKKAIQLDEEVFDKVGCVYANCRTFQDMEALRDVMPLACIISNHDILNEEGQKWERYYIDRTDEAMEAGKFLTALRFLEEALRINPDIDVDMEFKNLKLKGLRFEFSCLKADEDSNIILEAIQESHDFFIYKKNEWTHLLFVKYKNTHILEEYKSTPLSVHNDMLVENDESMPDNLLAQFFIMLGLENVVRKLLLEDSAIVDDGIIHLCLYYDQPILLRTFLEYSNESDSFRDKFSNLLMKAIAMRSHRCTRVLIEMGADPQSLKVLENCNYLLFEAVSNANLQLITHLSNLGVKLDQSRPNGMTSFLIAFYYAFSFKNRALKYAYFNVLETLLAFGVDINLRMGKYQETALIIASKSDSVEAINWLLDHGADPNLTSSKGTSALMVASDLNVVRKLVDRGAELEIKNEDGETALLLIASKSDSLEAVNWLLDHGADPNVTSSNGTSILMAASNVSVIRSLVERGVELEIKNNRGETALTIALKSGMYRKAMLLSELGASSDVRNENGKTVLMSMIKKRDISQWLSLENKIHMDTLQMMRIRFRSESEVNLHKIIKFRCNIDAKTQNGQTALMRAVKYLYESVVRILLIHHADANIEDAAGNTALHIACEIGSTKIASILLEHGAKVNIRNLKRQSPLVLAVKSGSFELVSLLLIHGANINLSDEEGRTPLMLSCMKLNHKMTAYLIISGAMLDRKDIYGSTALIIAAQQNNTIALMLLIHHQADIEIINKSGITALMAASYHAKSAVVTVLLEAKAKTDICINSSALIWASSHPTNIENLMLLLKYGAKINQQQVRSGHSALMVASYYNNLEAVKALVFHGANIDLCTSENETALTIAKLKKHDRVVEFLQDAQKNRDSCGDKALSTEAQNENGSGLQVLVPDCSQNQVVEPQLHELLLKYELNDYTEDNTYQTILMIAAIRGYVDLVKCLLMVENKIINRMDKNGNTALMHASENNQVEVVKILLKADAKLNIKNEQHRTALSLALLKQHVDIVECLLGYEAETDCIDRIDCNGVSTLMMLSKYPNIKVIQYLINQDVDVNHQSNDGTTALMIASRFGHLEIVKMLYAHGAIDNTKDRDGMSALMYALTNGHPEIAKYLILHSADVNATDHHGWNALKFAALYGYRDIVGLLLSKGAIFSYKASLATSPELVAMIDEELDKINKADDVKNRFSKCINELEIVESRKTDRLNESKFIKGEEKNSFTDQSYEEWPDSSELFPFFTDVSYSGCESWSSDDEAVEEIVPDDETEINQRVSP